MSNIETSFVCNPDISKHVKAAALFADKDKSHPVLTGILLKLEGHVLTIAATCGKTLYHAEVRVEVAGDCADSSPALEVIVPPTRHKDLIAILSAGGGATATMSHKSVTVSGNGTTVTVAGIEGTYPLYRNALPVYKGRGSEDHKQEGAFCLDSRFLSRLEKVTRIFSCRNYGWKAYHNGTGRGTIWEPLTVDNPLPCTARVTILIMPITLPE